jgi:hypothetical protein
LNKIESPGSNVEVLTLFSVLHAVEAEVPLFESFPKLELT